MPKGHYRRDEMTGGNRTWTQEEDDFLRHAVEVEGMSYTALRFAFNAHFKTDRTRNACLGRANRLGLRSRNDKGGRPGRGGRGQKLGMAKRVPIPQTSKATRPSPRLVAANPSPTMGPTIREQNIPNRARSLGSNGRVRITKDEIAKRRLGTLPEIVEVAKPATAKHILECGDHECRWPASPDIECMEVCGAPVSLGAYCDRHGALAYTLGPTRKRQNTMRADNKEYRVRLVHEQEREMFYPPALPSPETAPILMLEDHSQDA